MKKLLLLAAIGLVAVANSFGQGTLIFNNNAQAAFNLTTNNATGDAPGVMSGTGRYRVGLYASTNLAATAGSLELVGLATNTALAGKFNGGSAFVLPAGYPTSQQIVFQLRAWSLGAGTSFAEALTAAAADPLNVALGTSPLGTTTPGGGLVQAGALFGTTPGLLTSGFVVAPIPEPSTIALGLLGLGAIALFRRRK
jgi:hypothetical protein